MKCTFFYQKLQMVDGEFIGEAKRILLNARPNTTALLKITIKNGPRYFNLPNPSKGPMIEGLAGHLINDY